MSDTFEKEMAFRAKEMMKKIVRKVGEDNVAPGVKESLKKCLPDNKLVMGRSKRGLYGGRHIQFGNQISEDGGNKLVSLSLSKHIIFLYVSFSSFASVFSFLLL